MSLDTESLDATRPAGEAECLRALNGMIEVADRDALGAAQNLLLRFALGLDGTEARVSAMDNLLADISRGGTSGRSPAQQAFQTVVLGMIERTKLMVGPSGKGVQA